MALSINDWLLLSKMIAINIREMYWSFLYRQPKEEDSLRLREQGLNIFADLSLLIGNKWKRNSFNLPFIVLERICLTACCFEIQTSLSLKLNLITGLNLTLTTFLLLAFRRNSLLSNYKVSYQNIKWILL